MAETQASTVVSIGSADRRPPELAESFFGKSVLVGHGEPQRPLKFLEERVYEITPQIEASDRLYGLLVLQQEKFIKIKNTDTLLQFQQLASEGNLTADKLSELDIACDLFAFTKSCDYHDLMGKFGPVATRKTYRDSTKPAVLYRIFKGLQVTADVPSNHPRFGKKSPLFYEMNTANQLTANEARNADYHIGLWDLYNVQLDTYPVADSRAGQVSFLAVRMLHTLVNPNYGGGRRRTDGVFMLSTKVKGFPSANKVPLTTEVLKTWFGRRYVDRSTGIPLDRATEFFYKAVPELTELRGSNLLHPLEDFRIYDGSQTDAVFAAPREVRGRAGAITYSDTRYFLGAEFGKGDYMSLRLSEDLVAIYKKDGTKIDRIVHLWDEKTRTRMLRKTKQRSSQRDYPDATRGSFHIHGIEKADTAVQYISHHFEDYQHVSLLTSVTSGVKLASFPVAEQARLVSLYMGSRDKEAFGTFLSKYKQDGLKALMLVGVSEGQSDAVTSLQQHPHTELLMTEVAEIYDALRTYTKQEGQDDFSGLVSGRVYALLKTASVFTRREGEHDNIVHVLSTLFRYRINVCDEIDVLVGRGDAKQLRTIAYRTDPEQAVLADIQREEKMWEKGAKEKEKASIVATEAFYRKNDDLYATLQQTTGDTKGEQLRFADFVKRYPDFSKNTRFFLDLGSGQKGRMTKFLQQVFPGAAVIGLDLQPADKEVVAKKPKKSAYLQGNIASLPFASNSVDGGVMFWSVFNDLTDPKLQVEALIQMQRVMKKGAMVYVATPNLEGGPKGWMDTAVAQKREDPQRPFGMIDATIAGREKKFYIMPEKTIVALFRKAGFTLREKVSWDTQSGKPRKDYVFELTKKPAARKRSRRM